MTILFYACAAFLIAAGVIGFVSPASMPRLGRRFLSRQGLFVGVLIRATFAVALWSVAPSSAMPFLFRVLAVAMVLGAMSLPLMGVEGLRKLIERSEAQGPMMLRLWLASTAAVGVFLIWAARGP